MDSKEIQAVIHNAVEHEVGHAVTGPQVINRVIGESMRHIGKTLQLEAGAYLPVRPEEVLCKPERLDAESLDAVVLVRRQIAMDNTYLVLANARLDAQGARHFDFWAYKPDEFDLAQTKFITVPVPVANEILRQLSIVMKGEGAILVQAVSVVNYFPEEGRLPPAAGANELFSSDTADTADTTDTADNDRAREALAVDAGGLPPVNHELL